MVNVVELACSIGIPLTYTKTLEINAMGAGKRLLIMGVYILGYMVDDLVVFGLAIWGADRLGLTTACYTRWSNLLGGITMLGLGVLMLLKPGCLRFWPAPGACPRWPLFSVACGAAEAPAS